MNNIIVKQAAELLMQDLFDCLYAEQFFQENHCHLRSVEQLHALYGRFDGLESQSLFTGLAGHAKIWQWQLPSDPLTPHLVQSILVAVAPGIVQTLQRVQDTPVYLMNIDATQSRGNVERLTPISFMERVTNHLPAGLHGHELGANKFLHTLKETLKQTAWSLEHCVDGTRLLEKNAGDVFQALEEWSSLRDRPFHPVAKAKMGFTEQDYRQYMAEFKPEVRLNWVAVKRDCLSCGVGVNSSDSVNPAQFLLSEMQRQALQLELTQRGIEHSHTALPVHPWQLHHALPKHLPAALECGDCTVLDFQDAVLWATSSVRSMAPQINSEHYLKLPLAIYSLGASRYLPAVKMINGQRSEKLLHQALALDSVLSQRVFVCDETKWWAYMPANASLFDEAPRHLSIRFVE
jgi:staphyloferrin B synthase